MQVDMRYTASGMISALSMVLLHSLVIRKLMTLLRFGVTALYVDDFPVVHGVRPVQLESHQAFESQIGLNFKAIWRDREWYRLATNFFYFGHVQRQLDIFTVFINLSFLIRNCKSLEGSFYRNRPADFLWMLVVGATLILITAPLVPELTFILSWALATMIQYGEPQLCEHVRAFILRSRSAQPKGTPHTRLWRSVGEEEPARACKHHGLHRCACPLCPVGHAGHPHHLRYLALRSASRNWRGVSRR